MTTAVDKTVENANTDDRFQQARYVFHSGQTRDEVELKLRRYGITIDFPTNRDGSVVNLEGHRQWIDERRAEEQGIGLPLPTNAVPSSSLPLLETFSATSMAMAAAKQPTRFGVNKYKMDEEPSTTVKKTSEKTLLDQQMASDRNVTSNHGDKKPSHFDDIRIGKRAAPTSVSELEEAAVADNEHQRKSVNVGVLNVSSIILPRDSDVLFGRGSGIQNHPGNAQFRHLLEENLRAFTSGSDVSKRNLVNKLIDHMKKSSDVRFLRQDPNGVSWNVVQDQSVLQQKFYQTFRSLRAAAKKK